MSLHAHTTPDPDLPVPSKRPPAHPPEPEPEEPTVQDPPEPGGYLPPAPVREPGTRHPPVSVLKT